MTTTNYTSIAEGLEVLRDAAANWAFTVNENNSTDRFKALAVEEYDLFNHHIERLEAGDLTDVELIRLGAFIGQFAYMTGCHIGMNGVLEFRPIPLMDEVSAAVHRMQEAVLTLWPLVTA